MGIYLLGVLFSTLIVLYLFYIDYKKGIPTNLGILLLGIVFCASSWIFIALCGLLLIMYLILQSLEWIKKVLSIEVIKPKNGKIH